MKQIEIINKVIISMADRRFFKGIFFKNLVYFLAVNIFWILIFISLYLFHSTVSPIDGGASILIIFILLIFLVYAWIQSFVLKRSFKRRQNNCSSSGIWIARIDEKIVVRIDIVFSKKNDFSLISRIVVDFGYRRKGIGSRLISTVAATIEKPIYVFAVESARDFYSSNGFIPITKENCQALPGDVKADSGMMVLL